MSGQKIGVAIIAFDRPDYLAGLVESLAGGTRASEGDYHLFQDGVVNRWSGRVAGLRAGMRESLGVFRDSALPVKYEHCRDENLGIAVNQFEALEFMCGQYERVVLLEDDVVLSPHYLRLAGVLFDQLEDRGDVFSFCLGFKRLCARYQVGENLDKMIRVCGHWWGECLWSAKWKLARPHFMEYYHLVGDVDYQERPDRAIRALMERNEWPSPSTSQDAAKDMAVYAAGMERVRLVVNRGISVGRRGVHFTPVIFQRLGLDDQEPFVFASDAELDWFEWRG